jgi:hypothetical protein
MVTEASNCVCRLIPSRSWLSVLALQQMTTIFIYLPLATLIMETYADLAQYTELAKPLILAMNNTPLNTIRSHIPHFTNSIINNHTNDNRRTS